MKSLVRKVAWIPVLLASTLLHAASLKDVAIRPEGAGAVDEGYVRAHIAVKGGEVLDPARVSKDVKNLLATGRFADVRVEVTEAAEGPVLTYVVRPRLWLAEPVNVSGAKAFHVGRVRKILDLKQGDLVDESVLAVRAEKLKEEYRDYHYTDVSVETTLEVVDAKAGTARALVSIKEGAHAGKPRVVFSGNKAISSKSLRATMGVHPWYDVTEWFSSDEFDADRVAAMRQAVMMSYLEKGYLDVRADEPEWIRKPGQKRATVRFPINEGAVYRLGKAEVRGASLFPEADLAKLVTLRRGEPVSMAEVGKSAEGIRTYYTGRGYLRTTVKYALKQQQAPSDKAGGVVDVIFSISEGSLVYVRNVFIRGNTVTKDEVIRRELAIYPGEVFDERRVRSSENRLRNLGYFARVASAPEATEKLDENDLTFEVEERPTGSFMLGGGFSSVDKVMGYVEVSEGNFDMKSWPPKGGGQRVMFRGQFGSKSSLAEISFVEPWLMGRKLALDLNLYSRRNDYSDYDVKRQGFGIGLGSEIRTPFFNRADVRYEIEDSEISNVADTNTYLTMTDPPTNYWFAYSSQLKSRVVLSLTRETRDNFFFPSTGNRVVVAGEIAGGILGGDSETYELRAKAEQYFPLWSHHVLGLMGRMEVVDEYGDEPMQISDRLYVGGGRTIRGFEYRGIGPKVYREISDTRNGETFTHRIYRMKGGKSLATATAEYVIPVVEKIRIAGFVDAGNVWEEPYQFDLQDYAASAGIELRLDMPQFPIKLSYAWNLKKDDPSTDTQRWGFWIGSGF